MASRSTSLMANQRPSDSAVGAVPTSGSVDVVVEERIDNDDDDKEFVVVVVVCCIAREDAWCQETGGWRLDRELRRSEKNTIAQNANTYNVFPCYFVTTTLMIDVTNLPELRVNWGS